MAPKGRGDGLVSVLVLILFHVTAGSISNSLYTAEDSVRWDVSDYGPCTVACGGGVQSRTVKCMRDPKWDKNAKPIEVLGTLCPVPAPPVARSCNSHICTARWTTGDWSECSATCGLGTQEREVKCESSLWGDQSIQVGHLECGGSTPIATRKCHVTDCPVRDEKEPYSILSEKYTLIQLKRIKKMKVVIGGTVKLLPGQSVVVKCPVKRYSKKLMYWSRGYKLVSFMGRVRATSGGLRIKKANPATDGGVYTCIAGDKEASIKVEFIQKKDPQAKMYKKWIRKSEKQAASDANNPQGSNEIALPSSSDDDDLSRQRDQSQSLFPTLTFVSGSWSECSATCGSEGHRERNVTCSHVTPKYVKIVLDEKCERIGLVKPETIQTCSVGDHCPVWRAGPWSECRPSCGKSGEVRRILTCVWKDTGLPAWNTCDRKLKPPATKPCKTRPCPAECKNHSPYCSLAKHMKLCRFEPFREQCCQTCHKLMNSTL